MARCRNATHPSLLCYWLSKIAVILTGATRDRFLIQTRRNGQLAFAVRDGSGASLAVAGGMIAGGLTVMTFGMTRVFVPQDLTFMRPREVRSANNKRAPDTLDCSRPRRIWRRNLYDGSHGAPLRVVCQALTKSLADIVSRRGDWVCSGNRVHPIVGYNDLLHLAPAILGAIMFIAGLILCWKPMQEGPGTRC